ncbi:aminoglycoside phosphotransferase, partial [Saccharopolyspora griseoalba]
MSRPPELTALDLGDVTVDEVLRTSKKMLATGHHGDLPVIVKALRGDEDFWAARFAHEIRTCKAFSEHPPPVRVPRLVHADSHRVLVV